MVQYDTRDWLGLLLRLRGTVVPRIAVRVIAVAAIALVAYLARREGVADVRIPSSVHTLVGVALGLLLVFRTNASYDRYWEGRRLVGHAINNCRDLSRQAASYLDAGVRRDHAALIVALFATMRRYLRSERDWTELEVRLGPARVAALADARCPPLVVARWLGELYAAEAAAGRLSEHRLALLDGAVSDVLDCLGGCERIVRTPVPFAYAHHIKGFLTLFCFTVPMALLDSMGGYTIVASSVVAYALFGIDEIGVEIEDPFGHDANDLPLDGIGDTLAIDVDQQLAADPR